MNLFSKKGQTLIEALVALGLLLMGIFGIFTLMNQSFALNRTVTDRHIGNFLAAEGIEVVKNLIDENVIKTNAWNAGLTAGTHEVEYDSTALEVDTNRLFTVNDSHIYSYDTGGTERETIYRRDILIAYPDCPGSANCSDHMQVNSRVTWQSIGGGLFSVNLEDHFYNWQ